MREFYKKYGVLQGLIYLTLIIFNVFTVLNAYVSTSMTNSVMRKDMESFKFYMILALVIMIASTIINYISGILKARSKKNIACNIRRKYLSNFVNSYNLSDDHTPEKGVSHLTYDVSFLIQHEVDARYRLVNTLLGAIFPLCGAMLINWSFIIVFPVSALISMFAMKQLSPIMSKVSREQSDENEVFVGRLTNLLGGFETLFAYKALKGFSKNVDEASVSLETRQEIFARKMEKAKCLSYFALFFSQILYVFVAGYLVVKGSITAGAIVGLMMLAGNFFQNIQGAMQIQMEIQSSKANCNKLIKDLIPKKEKRVVSEIKEGIVLKNISYIYPESEKEVFKNFSYNFPLGGKYLIRGKSGSGKSTLLKLISGRLKGYSGEIYYDSNEIGELSSDELVDLIAYVNQDTYIFEDSIKNNITLGHDYDKKQYMDAIEKAGLKKFVREKGDDFIIVSEGKNISGGEKQRIALARAILYGKKIFLIDEGFTGLDIEVARDIEDNLLKLIGYTIFIVSHREHREEEYNIVKIA